MKILSSLHQIQVAGGCYVTIGGYSINAAGVDCEYAQASAKMYNYDLSTSGLIGYQPGGYPSMNIYSSQPTHILVSKNLNFQEQFYGFKRAMEAVIPASFFPE